MITINSFLEIVHRNRHKYATLLWDTNGKEYFIPKKNLCSIDDDTVIVYGQLKNAELLFVVDLNHIVGMETIK